MREIFLFKSIETNPITGLSSIQPNQGNCWLKSTFPVMKINKKFIDTNPLSDCKNLLMSSRKRVK